MPEDEVVLTNRTREEDDEREAKALAIGNKFRPTEDRVLCLLDDKDKEIGGIIIPDAAGEAKQEATVIAVGPGRTTEDGTVIPVKIEKGWRVVLPVYGGSNVAVAGTKFQLINEKDILGIIDEEVTDGE